MSNDKKEKGIEEKIESDLSSFDFRKNVFKGEKKKSLLESKSIQNDIDMLKKISVKLDEKVDKLKDVQYKQSNTLSSIEVIMKRNTDSLVEHMRRTKASESRLEHIEDKELKYRSFIKGTSIIISVLLSGILFYLSNFK